MSMNAVTPAAAPVLHAALLQINPVVGDLAGNARLIAEAARQAYDEGARLVVTPEMALCGYPPEDLLLRPAFLLGMLYVFVDGMTTLSSVIFLISGDHKLASVVIFNHANSGEYGYAAAKSVAIMAIAAMAMLLIWLYERQGPQSQVRPIRSRPDRAADKLRPTLRPDHA